MRSKLLKNFIGYISRMRESTMGVDDMFRKRSSSKEGAPSLKDGEFYSSFDYDRPSMRPLRDAYRNRDFESAACEMLALYKGKRVLAVSELRDSSTKKRMSAHFPSFAKRTVDQADAVCSHRFSLPTLHRADFGTLIDWSCDFNGEAWPYLHSSDFQRRIQDRLILKSGAMQNLAAAMEFNKHHHFTALARAFVLTDDEKYAQEFVIEIEDWISKNPIHWGVAWADPLTVAQRVVSWIFSLSIFLECSSYMQGEHLQEILKSLLLHGAYLFSIISSKGQLPSRNIAAASALYAFASFFPEFNCSERWRNSAARMLENESSSYFLTDGVCRGRSLGLQVLMTEFLMLPLLCNRIFGESSSPAILSVVERSLEFMMYTMAPSGRIVNFGDSPASRLWYFSSFNREDFRNLLCIGAYLFNRGDMKFCAGKMYEDLFWFFRTDGEFEYAAIEENRPSAKAKVFIDGGYFSFRDSWYKDATFCLFYGNLKKQAPQTDRAAMSLMSPHRDALSFVLFVRGEPVIVESGAFKGCKRTQGVPPGDYFPSAFAHNSVLVNSKEQSLQKNVRSSKKYTHFLKTKWFFSDDFDYALAGNLGFEDVKSLVVHRREILCIKSKKWFIVRDTLEGSDEFMISNVFNFAPGPNLTLRNDHGCLIRSGHEYIRLNMYYPAPFECSLVRGRVDPPAGWYSEDSSRLDACNRIEYRCLAPLPARVYTWITWARGDFRPPQLADLEAEFERAEHAGGICEDDVQFETSDDVGR